MKSKIQKGTFYLRNIKEKVTIIDSLIIDYCFIYLVYFNLQEHREKVLKNIYL